MLSDKWFELSNNNALIWREAISPVSLLKLLQDVFISFTIQKEVSFIHKGYRRSMIQKFKLDLQVASVCATQDHE